MEVAASCPKRYSLLPSPSLSLSLSLSPSFLPSLSFPLSFLMFLLIPLGPHNSLCSSLFSHRYPHLPPPYLSGPRDRGSTRDRDGIEKVEGNGESSPRKRNTTSPAAIAGSPFSGSFVVAWVGG